MKGSNFWRVLRLSVLLVIGLFVVADTVIDQEQADIDQGVAYPIGGPLRQAFAQIVTAGIPGPLTEVRFPIKAISSEQLIVEIQGVDSQGMPNGTILASQSFDPADFPEYPNKVAVFRAFRFTTPCSFQPGERFAIVLRTVDQVGGWPLQASPTGDLYLGGVGYGLYDGGYWGPIGGGRLDWPFQTVVGWPYQHVEISVKPGSDPAPINTRTDAAIPVAILTTADFQASAVDPETVRFGVTGMEAVAFNWAMEDVDADGDLDLMLHFRTQATRLQYGDIAASLRGYTFDGLEIRGSSAIKTVK